MTPAATPAPAVSQAASPLVAYRGDSRVFVVSAPTSRDAGFVRQMRAFKGMGYEVDARNIVIVPLVGVVPPGGEPRLDPAAVRRFTGLRPDRFGVALIGKDGHVALKRDHPVTATKLFGVIDAMPMRRDEMRAAEPRTKGKPGDR